MRTPDQLEPEVDGADLHLPHHQPTRRMSTSWSCPLWTAAIKLLTNPPGWDSLEGISQLWPPLFGNSFLFYPKPYLWDLIRCHGTGARFSFRGRSRVSYSMEILEEHVGVWTSFPRHREFIAELPRKLFNQRMTEKADVLTGIEAEGWVRLMAGDQLGGWWNNPGKKQWGSEQYRRSGRKWQGQDLMALHCTRLATSASFLMNQVGWLSQLHCRGHCWLVHGNTWKCFICTLLGCRDWQISRTTEPDTSFITWQNDSALLIAGASS